jgi:hypothetical protein
MYPDTLATGVPLPALTFQMITEVSELTQDGDCGLYTPRWQFDAWAKTAIDRETLGNAVRTALHGFAGFMTSGSPETGTGVDVAIWQNSIDSYEPDRKQYRRMLDFIILHE